MVVVQRSGHRTSALLTSNYSIIAILVLLNILCFQLGRNYESSSSSGGAFSVGDPLRPQPGAARALPSIRVADDAADQRKFYGGKGDAKHLGGWTEIDIQGISPFLWKLMMTKFGIHSILDVGCGRGISTTWFLMNGMDALCVEGSHDAYLNSVLPDKDKQMVEHDFSRGPYWPEKTYDAVWCVEFLEHVSNAKNQKKASLGDLHG
jgi:Methyltransferase domain